MHNVLWCVLFVDGIYINIISHVISVAYQHSNNRRSQLKLLFVFSFIAYHKNISLYYFNRQIEIKMAIKRQCHYLPWETIKCHTTSSGFGGYFFSLIKSVSVGNLKQSQLSQRFLYVPKFLRLNTINPALDRRDSV